MLEYLCKIFFLQHIFFWQHRAKTNIKLSNMNSKYKDIWQTKAWHMHCFHLYISLNITFFMYNGYKKIKSWWVKNMMVNFLNLIIILFCFFTYTEYNVKYKPGKRKKLVKHSHSITLLTDILKKNQISFYIYFRM